MVTLVNRAKMSIADSSLGSITLGSAVERYQSFADAGVVDGDEVRYTIEDGLSWEIGSGTYSSSGTTLTRTVDESSDGGTAISLSLNAVVFVTAAGDDLQNAADMDQGVATTDSPEFAGLTATTADINGGTIDGTVIGGSTAAAISGTTGTFSGDLTVDTDTLFVDASTNQVGIGTSSPFDALHVEGTIRGNVSSASDENIRLTTTGGGGFVVDVDDATVANPTWSIRTFASEPLTFEISNSEAMRIDSSGNVGIGTSSPDEELHVYSDNAPVVLIEAAAGNDSRLRLRTPNDRIGYIEFGDAADIDTGEIRYEHSSNAMVFSTNGNSERLRIDSSGVVEVAEGSVVLNGNTISAVQVIVADDAVAELTFTNRRFGMLNVVEGSDDDVFPDQEVYFLGWVDFGNSDVFKTAIKGPNTQINDSSALTGATGTDGDFTIGVAGTSGTLYLENRRGGTRTLNVTLL